MIIIKSNWGLKGLRTIRYSDVGLRFYTGTAFFSKCATTFSRGSSTGKIRGGSEIVRSRSHENPGGNRSLALLFGIVQPDKYIQKLWRVTVKRSPNMKFEYGEIQTFTFAYERRKEKDRKIKGTTSYTKLRKYWPSDIGKWRLGGV